MLSFICLLNHSESLVAWQKKPPNADLYQNLDPGMICMGEWDKADYPPFASQQLNIAYQHTSPCFLSAATHGGWA